MKRGIIIIVFLSFTILGYAQIGKSDWIISGMINYSGSNHSKLDSLNESTSRYVNERYEPCINYFIKDNFSIGLILAYGNNSIRQTNEGAFVYGDKYTYESSTDIMGIGFKLSKYISISNKLYLVFENKNFYNYSIQKIDKEYSNSDIPFPSYNPAHQKIIKNEIRINLVPELVYFAFPHFGISTSFGEIKYSYSHSKNKSLHYNNHNKNSDYGINFDASTLYLGIVYRF